MYTHANMYGQPAFGGPTFQHPSMNYYSSSSYHQQQHYLPHPPPVPQPPPVYYTDPNTFRKNYMNHLAGLTFNSRPMIQELSWLAQENSRYADIVVSCVEAHIRKVSPSMKLPAFYLLDAMSKNIREPYANYAKSFASVVAPLFLETYSQVDEQTRKKMEEMLITWRSASPTGNDLFGPVTQLAIERGVWGDGTAVSVSNPGLRTRPSAVKYGRKITKSQVLSELQFAIGQKERALQANPYDSDASRKLEVLHQLRNLITDVGVSQEELRQILGQLRELVKGSAPPPPPPSVSRNSWQQTIPNFTPQSRPPSTSQQYPPPSGFPSAPYSTPPLPQPPGPVPSSSSIPPSLPNAENIAKILNTLKNAGVLANASASPSAQQPDPSSAKESSNEGAAAFREYKASLLANKSIFSSTEILRTTPRLTSFISESMPSQCKQCGLRFADTPYGKTKLQQHLDIHFEQNRKGPQNPGRGPSRSWFVNVDDWMCDGSGSSKGKARVGRTSSKVSHRTEQDLRSLYVVVPAGDEAKNVSCPICKEKIKSEFLDDDEEWVWKNAVLKDEKIYHATCHAEALTSTSGIAARLRHDIVGSRGATPEVSGSTRSTPPPSFKTRSPSPESKFGVKRKVESDSEAENGTPPVKKVALSTVS